MGLSGPEGVGSAVWLHRLEQGRPECPKRGPPGPAVLCVGPGASWGGPGAGRGHGRHLPGAGECVQEGWRVGCGGQGGAGGRGCGAQRLGAGPGCGAGGGGRCRGRAVSPAQQPEPGAALMGVIGSGLWRGRSGPANAKQKLLTAVMARYGYDYCCNPQQQVLPGEPPGPGPGRADGAAPWDPERAPGAAGRPRRGVWGGVGVGVPLNSSRATMTATGAGGSGAGHGARGGPGPAAAPLCCFGPGSAGRRRALHPHGARGSRATSAR